MHTALKAAVLSLAAVLGLAACAGDAPDPDPDNPRPLVVDLDMDSSDVMALGYVLNLPGYDVVAVTVPGTGVGRCPQAAANARRVIEAMGVEGVPVGCGDDAAVGSGHPFPDAWRDPSDALYGIRMGDQAADTSGPGAPSASEVLVQALHDAGQPVDVLTLGPLTNVARVLKAEPSISDRIDRVVAMAGAFDVAGNVEDPAVGSPEWNVWADPAALAAVLESGVDVVLVPLDATDDVPVDGRFYGSLSADHAAAAADLTYELLTRNAFLLGGGQFFWDPLAASYLEDPDVVETETADVRVGTDGQELGRTIRGSGGHRAVIARAGQRDAFDDMFLAGLRRGGERQDPFVPSGPLAVSYDGTRCTIAGATALSAGPIRVTFSSRIDGSTAAALVTLHPDASWEQLEAFLATFDPSGDPPDFAEVGAVVFPTTGVEAITDAAAGTTGVACVEMDEEGVAQRVTMSEPFEVEP
jgi:inosine-uridine nucleoside N-ribohydrolase